MRASASSASRPVASTPWPSRTIRVSRTATSGSAPIEQLDRVGAAVDRGDRSHVIGRLDARTGRPPVAQLVEHLVAERVDAAALGQRLRGQHVQALDPVGHAAGRDAVDLRHAAELGPGREVALVRRGVRRRQLGVGAEPRLHLLHQARSPRASRSATRPAGRSGRRWSGTACRRAAGARWPPRRAARRGSGARRRAPRARDGRAAGRPPRGPVGGGSITALRGSPPRSPRRRCPSWCRRSPRRAACRPSAGCRPARPRPSRRSTRASASSR